MLRRHKRLAFAGSVHFVTTVTSVRGQWFVVPSICTEMLEIFEQHRRDTGVICLGYVLMPDHLHALMLQEVDGAIVSEFMRRFKRKTSFPFRPAEYPERDLWRRRFDDNYIPGPDAMHLKLNYMHHNPVKKVFAETAEAYPWSSARDYLLNQPGLVTVAKEKLPPLMP
ncbi:transposase [candidate division KSB1 bacterium]|nr:transposase [candidate division KSB1 bacterium]